MKLVEIKVGYLISYDYEYFFTSVEYVYKHVDEIFLAIDKDHYTWSGKYYEISDDFFERLKKLDINNKIKIYKDSFYKQGLSPIECDTREREMLNKFMGRGWKIQLDSDEYMPEFEKISEYLRKYWYLTLYPKWTPILFQARLITLIKKSDAGFYFVDNNESFPFATNQDNFTTARINYQIKNFNCEAYCIHQSWARSKSELEFKVVNWGHSGDFDVFEFVNKIDSITLENFKDFKNFHPLSPFRWSELNFQECRDIGEFVKMFVKKRPQKLKDIQNHVIFKAALRKIKRLIQLN